MRELLAVKLFFVICNLVTSVHYEAWLVSAVWGYFLLSTVESIVDHRRREDKGVRDVSVRAKDEGRTSDVYGYFRQDEE